MSGIGTLLSVLIGRLARIVDRARVLKERLETPEPIRAAAMIDELHVLETRGRLIHRAIRVSTISALLVCFLVAALFASAMLQESTRLVVSGLFIAAMLASIVSLIFFLREVSLAIETF